MSTAAAIQSLQVARKKSNGATVSKKSAVRLSHPLEAVLRRGVVIMGEKMSKKEFVKFSQENEALQMERESDGTIIIMPTNEDSGHRELGVGAFLFMWSYQTKNGKAYGASAGIDLPDGSSRAADASWISNEKVKLLPSVPKFLQLVPDFVVEVRSSSDRIGRVLEKMRQTWMKNGVRLAWLIDSYEEKAYIFRANGEEEIVEGFAGKTLTGEDVMPGLEVPLDVVQLKKP